MTVTFAPVGAVLGAGAAVTLAKWAGMNPAAPDWQFAAVLVAGVALGIAAWEFSPLPSDSGGIASTDPLHGRYWGFHPGPIGSKPTHVSRHESEPRVLYYFDDGALAVDIAEGVKEWAETAETADEKLRARIQRRDEGG